MKDYNVMYSIPWLYVFENKSKITKDWEGGFTAG